MSSNSKRQLQKLSLSAMNNLLPLMLIELLK
jgi:hypothetical protein